MPPPSKTTRVALRDLALGASVEILPGQLPPPEVLAGHLPRGTSVYVPFPPKGRWPDTIAACEQVLATGMRPVPHLAARSVRSPDELDDWLSALVDAGVDSLMLVAGDRATPAGPYPDSPALLDSGLLAEHGLRRIGVTSYPEGHPLIGQADLDEALRRKTEYARATGSELWIVTQFVFSPSPALAWLERTRETGCTLPVRIGVPGPVALSALIKIRGPLRRRGIRTGVETQARHRAAGGQMVADPYCAGAGPGPGRPRGDGCRRPSSVYLRRPRGRCGMAVRPSQRDGLTGCHPAPRPIIFPR